MTTARSRRGLRRLHQTAIAGTAALVAIVLPMHAAATFLHVAPRNPVGAAFDPAVTAWIYPYFQQNWKLFAPDPVSTDTGVLARGRTSQDQSEIGFVDLSTPMLERKLHNPLPDRLHYLVSSAGHTFLTARQEVLNAVDEAALPTATATTNDQDSDVQAELLIPDSVLEQAPSTGREMYEDALSNLLEITAANVEDATGTAPSQLQVRLVTHTFPRWSKRHDDGVGVIGYSDLPWFDIETKDFLS